MSYKRFTVDKLRQQFGLSLEKHALFGTVISLAPSAWLQATLNLVNIIAVSSEKAKSKLIMPILAEVAKTNQQRISLYSGVSLNAAPALGLNGECDFIFSNKPDGYFLE